MCVLYRKKGWTWHIVKHRGEVRGSGRKLRPQKKTGRARISDGKAPQCRGGGAGHGIRPMDHSIKLNVETRELGYKIALTARYQEGKLLSSPSPLFPSHITYTVRIPVILSCAT